MKNQKNYKSLIIKIAIFICLFVLLTLIGTYAVWIWRSEVNKDVVFNTSKELQEYIVYDAGDSKFIGDFQIANSFCESQHTTLSFYKTEEAANVPLYATINMKINSIGANISSSSDVYWILTKGDSNIICTEGLSSLNIVDYDNFQSATDNDSLTLKANIPVTTDKQEFTVWIWIDANGSNLSTLTGETIDVNIWTQIDTVPIEQAIPNAPVLDEGMIPVTISNNGTVTTVSEIDSSWYDYGNKKWANAVLVSSTNRTTYQTAGQTVDQNDILAYYVWIPRYKYRILPPIIASSETITPETIDIVFETVDTPKSAGTNVGDYLTHPAFTFGDEELSGFWVGKFETTGTADNPTILPGTTPATGQNISSQFATSRTLSASDNLYGLSPTKTDAHMMKNSEWGAVAYLSHSQYGINTEIRVNDSPNGDSATTGCGSTTIEYIEGNPACGIVYGEETNYPQSTTGNISGIFDMSGGAEECVMGNYNNIVGGSGFSSMPDSKYYDLYTIDSVSLCTNTLCAGHALHETANWYDDFMEFVYLSDSEDNNDGPWFRRSDDTFLTFQYSGIFGAEATEGGATSSTWRSVLAVYE